MKAVRSDGAHKPVRWSLIGEARRNSMSHSGLLKAIALAGRTLVGIHPGTYSISIYATNTNCQNSELATATVTTGSTGKKWSVDELVPLPVAAPVTSDQVSCAGTGTCAAALTYWDGQEHDHPLPARLGNGRWKEQGAPLPAGAKPGTAFVASGIVRQPAQLRDDRDIYPLNEIY